MSDSDSLFVGDGSNTDIEDLREGKSIHDAFIDRLAVHHASVTMDFDLWMKQIITIILNKAAQREWPIDQLEKAIDNAARQHNSLPSYIKTTLITPKPNDRGLDNEPSRDEGTSDDPDKYELVFTARELKACANLVENVAFAGNRRKNTQDRLYSLLRHKVLGQDAMNLDTALRRRKAEKERLKKKEEAKEKAAEDKIVGAAAETVQPSIETPGQGSKRPHESSDEDDIDSLNGVEILADEELTAARGEDWLDELQSSSDGDINIQHQTPAAKRPKIPVCFRVQTAHDRRKMQPKVSPAERIEQLKRESEKLLKVNRKLRLRVEEHKRARVTAEIARDKAEQREARTKEDTAAERLKISERWTKLERWKRTLEQDEKNVKSLNSKVNADFW